MRKLSLEHLNDLFAAIAESRTLYLPVDTAAGAKFERWENGKILSDALNTVRSAKDFFFPQTENLMDFKTAGKKIEIVDTRRECEDFVVFGVRACDVRSFDVLDKVFLAEPVDSYYKNRREHGVIVSLACTKPHETCFCTTFGIDAAAPAGDVTCWKTEDALYLEANTEKGTALLDSLSALTADADGKAVAKQQEATRERMKKLPLANLTPTNSARTRPKNSSVTPHGRNCRSPVSDAEPAPLFARPANATTSRTSTRDMASSGSVAGIPVCIPSLPRCRQDSRV